MWKVEVEVTGRIVRGWALGMGGFSLKNLIFENDC